MNHISIASKDVSIKTNHSVLIALAIGRLGFAAGEASVIRIPYRALGDSALIMGEHGPLLGEEVTGRGKLSREFKKHGDLFLAYSNHV